MKPLCFSTYLLITLSLVFAILSNIIPVTPTLALIYPLWLPLILIYWVMVVPEHIHFSLVWCMGLIIDVLHGSYLGEHSLVLCIIKFLAYHFHLQFRMFPLTQQILFVFMLLLIYSSLLAWIQLLLKVNVQLSWLWTPLIVSALIWPLLQKILKIRNPLEVRH